MNKKKRDPKKVYLERLVTPIINPTIITKIIDGYAGYFNDKKRYSGMKGAEKMDWTDTYPCIFDKTSVTGFDQHYFYQDVWAFTKISNSRTPEHVDVGSSIIFVSLLTAITKVTFVDIRPLEADLDNFISKKGSILEMPYGDGSIPSLSCLHVAEHIGLGRYGDPLDPRGTEKACKELARVLAIGGVLYFSLPVGRPRLCFNAHRVHSPKRILDYFKGLELVEFSGIDDEVRLRKNIDPSELETAEYGCGLFQFTKK